MSRRRRETGGRALQALVALGANTRDGAIEDLSRLLRRHNGNATRAARELGLSAAPALLALVDALELREWLDSTWPERHAGGRPDDYGRAR